jgi:hypothetical protein
VTAAIGSPFCVEDHSGLFYFDVFHRLLERVRPQTYFEIGTEAGDTLALVECEAIAVDPFFQIGRNVFGRKPACHLYQMTSDAFFATHSPSAILGRPIELAFLDGWHWFEFLLRDFINTEPHCRPGSFIVLHDCLPTDLHIARREVTDTRLAARSAHPGWWAGDVWRTLVILQKYRPDLHIRCTAAVPTGLVLVGNLDPSSTVLRDAYERIVAEAAELELHDYGLPRLFEEAAMLPVGEWLPALPEPPA